MERSRANEQTIGQRVMGLVGGNVDGAGEGRPRSRTHGSQNRQVIRVLFMMGFLSSLS
jgi:hypothetical protein